MSVQDGQTASASAPVAFISYAHEEPAHKSWVAALATDLRRKGIDVILAQWDAPLGTDLTKFMESSIRKSSRVLLICTPQYARKASEGKGGVGWERLIVTAELLEHTDTTKFICVLRRGTKAESIPSFVQTRVYVDFVSDNDYDQRIDDLVRDIHNVPAHPKPPLGSNPFQPPTTNDPPLLISAAAIMDDPGSIPDDEAIDDLRQRAVALLRARDILGWRHLVRETRRTFEPALQSWRDSVPPSIRNTDEWVPVVDKVVRVAAAYMVLALTATESDIDAVKRQVGLLDDLVTPTEWVDSGSSHVVHVPELLGTVYHHILGAYFVDNLMHPPAIDLLCTSVALRIERQQGSPVWKHSELMGWTHSLGHNCESMWKYLRGLAQRHEWISAFFAKDLNFTVGLSAYQCLASCLELAEYIGRGGTQERLRNGGTTLDVPPMFLVEDYRVEDLTRVVRRAIPNREVLQTIAARYSVEYQSMVDFWPTWFGRLLRWQSSAGRHMLPGYYTRVPSLDPSGGMVALEKS